MVFENLAGKRLGQYELREMLGMGGMGAVYRGFQVSLKREVAVKVLSPQLMQQPGYVTRFTREAETSASLEHQHIVPIYDYGTQDNAAYVVMRLLKGGTLTDRLNRHVVKGAPLPGLGETARVLLQIASALDYAHQRGIIHRDIKPSNIMFDEQGSAYIVDFGIAKLLYATSSMTGTGMTLGTPAYMAPEQWRAEDLTGAADQYALGVMAYALVTGRVPFEAPTPHALMYKHLNETPPSPRTLRPEVPPSVAEVIAQALQKTPEKRFANVMAFATAFDAAVRGHTGDVTGFFTEPVIPATEAVTPPPSAAAAGAAPSTSAGASAPSAPLPLAAPVSTPPQASQVYQPAPVPTPPAAGQAATGTLARAGTLLRTRPVYGLVTLALVIILGAVGALALFGGSGDGGDSGAQPQAAASATLAPTEDDRIVLLVTPSATTAASDTPEPSATATATPSVTPTASATVTASPTATPQDTPDLEATAEAMVNARLTATANAWTDTPTPDYDATAEALVILRLTQTAESWTDTPTPSDTPTATVTPSPTPTVTPSRTPTVTPRPTSTRVPSSTPRPTSTLVPDSSSECDGFLTPRLTVGSRACVSDSEPNNIRSYPESLDIIGQIPPGGVFDVLDGPECTSGTVTVWYYVDYNGIVGWTAEGTRRTNTYWLSPLPCPISGSGNEYDYLVPDLDGTVLEVTEAGAPLNIRNAPGTSGQKIDEIYWGDRVLWGGRQSSADGYTWYEVTLYSNRTAYIAYRSDWLVTRDPAQTTPGIYIGATIRITHEGDDTHLRNRTSVINSTEVQTLYEGDTLTVIGGPSYSEYFLWWQLRLPDGRTGWAVDVPGWWDVQ